MISNIAQLIENMIENAKTDKSLLKKLKDITVAAQQFELAAEIRQMEKDCFPDTPEVAAAKERAKKINLLFRMVEINADDAVCYKLDETLKLYNKKKGKFNTDDAVEIMYRTKRIFDL
jgi:hypothetical protein